MANIELIVPKQEVCWFRFKTPKRTETSPNNKQ